MGMGVEEADRHVFHVVEQPGSDVAQDAGGDQRHRLVLNESGQNADHVDDDHFEQEFDEYGNLKSVKAFGGGFGHGVGLSQYGAGFMATELKKGFEEILKHYYTDIILATKPVILSPENSTIRQNFYTKNKHAEIVVDNKYKLSYFLVNINGKEHKFNFNNKFFDRVERFDISNHIKHGKNTVTFIYPVDEDRNKGIRLFVEL